MQKPRLPKMKSVPFLLHCEIPIRGLFDGFTLSLIEMMSSSCPRTFPSLVHHQSMRGDLMMKEIEIVKDSCLKWNISHAPCYLDLDYPCIVFPPYFFSPLPILLVVPFLPFSSISPPAEMLSHPYSVLPMCRTPSDWKSRIRRPMKARCHFKPGPHTINCRCQVVSQSKCEIGTLVSKCHDGRAHNVWVQM